MGEGRVTSVGIPITDIAANLGHDWPSHRTTRDLGPMDGFQDRAPVTPAQETITIASANRERIIGSATFMIGSLSTSVVSQK